MAKYWIEFQYKIGMYGEESIEGFGALEQEINLLCSYTIIKVKERIAAEIQTKAESERGINIGKFREKCRIAYGHKKVCDGNISPREINITSITKLEA